MATISYWLLILFLLSGGLSVESGLMPGHGEFPAEEDFASFDRQDESVRPSIARKRNTRGRKVIPFQAQFIAPRVGPWGHWEPIVSSPPSSRQLRQFNEVFRI